MLSVHICLIIIFPESYGAILASSDYHWILLFQVILNKLLPYCFVEQSEGLHSQTINRHIVSFK